jgi:hypothetical protein
MYTEQMTQGLCLGTPIQPQQLTTTTTLTSGAIDMQVHRRALFVLNLGAFGGTSPTCSAVITLQESPDNSTWTNNAIIPTTTVNAANTGGTVEVRAGQLGAGKRYARVSIVFTIGGTSPTIPVACLALGGEANHKPASLKNDTTTYPTANQTVVN